MTASCPPCRYDAIPLVRDVADLRNLGTAAAYAALAAVVTLAWRRMMSRGMSRAPGAPGGGGSHDALLCVVAAGAPFLPASHLLFPVGTVLGERLLYLPSVGLCLLVACAAAEAVPRAAVADGDASAARADGGTDASAFSPRRPRGVPGGVLAALVTLLAAALVAVSARRAGEWCTEGTLFEAGARSQPRSVRALNNLAAHLLASGDGPEDTERARSVCHVTGAAAPQPPLLTQRTLSGVGATRRARWSSTPATPRRTATLGSQPAPLATIPPR